MSNYINLQSILDASLGKYRNMGFRLESLSEQTIMLWFDHIPIGAFPADACTILSAQEACRETLFDMFGGE